MQPSKLALAIAAAAAAAVTTAASPCNGAAALCTRAYSNITFIGAHDSAFAGPLPSDNQLIPVDEQLARGVRFLQAQTHDVNDGGAIEMCHTDCLLLDAGPLSAYLAPVAAFLAANPNEVVSLLLTNGDAIPVARFADVFEAVGLVQYVFTPPGGGGLALEQWPTLQEMIDAGTRLVVWMDYHADASSVPWIMDEFAYFWETAYDVTDRNFPSCSIDRPGGASADGRMGIVNHMLHYEFFDIQVPAAIEAPITNSISSITKQTNICAGLYGRTPNVVLLDYIDLGDAMGAQAKLNGL